MSIEHQSLFTATDNTVVNTLSPAVGVALSTGSTTVVTTNRARPTATAEALTNESLSTANYDVRATIRRLASSANQLFFLYARATNVSNGYRLRSFNDSNSLRFERITGGTPTTVGSTTTWDPGTTSDRVLVLRVENSGADVVLTALADGVTILGPTTDTSSPYTAAGKAGLRWESGSSLATTGIHVETFEVDTIGGGGGSNAPRSAFYHLQGMR